MDTFQELFNIQNPTYQPTPPPLWSATHVAPRKESPITFWTAISTKRITTNWYYLSLCRSSHGAIYRFKQIPDWPAYTVRIVAIPSPSRKRTFSYTSAITRNMFLTPIYAWPGLAFDIIDFSWHLIYFRWPYISYYLSKTSFEGHGYISSVKDFE